MLTLYRRFLDVRFCKQIQSPIMRMKEGVLQSCHYLEGDKYVPAEIIHQGEQI